MANLARNAGWLKLIDQARYQVSHLAIIMGYEPTERHKRLYAKACARHSRRFRKGTTPA